MGNQHALLPAEGLYTLFQAARSALTAPNLGACPPFTVHGNRSNELRGERPLLEQLSSQLVPELRAILSQHRPAWRR